MEEDPLRERLRNAITAQDFEDLRGEYSTRSIQFQEVNYSLIKTAAVLAAYLNHHRGKPAIFFRKVCDYFLTDYRVDMLECFLPYVDFSTLFLQETERNCNSFLFRLVMEAPIDVTIFLLDHGLDVNQTFQGGSWSLLSGACNYRKVDLIDLLLTSGADVNKELGSIKTTAVFNAVNCDDIRVLDRLIIYGANLHVKSFGLSLLQLAARKRRIESMRRLVEMGVEIESDLI